MKLTSFQLAKAYDKKRSNDRASRKCMLDMLAAEKKLDSALQKLSSDNSGKTKVRREEEEEEEEENNALPQSAGVQTNPEQPGVPPALLYGRVDPRITRKTFSPTHQWNEKREGFEAYKEKRAKAHKIVDGNIKIREQRKSTPKPIVKNKVRNRWKPLNHISLPISA